MFKRKHSKCLYPPAQSTIAVENLPTILPAFSAGLEWKLMISYFVLKHGEWISTSSLKPILLKTKRNEKNLLLLLFRFFFVCFTSFSVQFNEMKSRKDYFLLCSKFKNNNSRNTALVVVLKMDTFISLIR